MESQRLPKKIFSASVIWWMLCASAWSVPSLSGKWVVEPAQNSALDPWRKIVLDIEVEGSAVTIAREVSAGRRVSSATYPLKIDETVKVPVAWWTGNRHIGAYMGGDGTETMRATWLDDRTLGVVSHYTLATSQGETPVRSTFEYRLSTDQQRLTVIELRSSRDRPIVHVYTRLES
jgi:hypothetical protein